MAPPVCLAGYDRIFQRAVFDNYTANPNRHTPSSDRHPHRDAFSHAGDHGHPGNLGPNAHALGRYSANSQDLADLSAGDHPMAFIAAFTTLLVGVFLKQFAATLDEWISLLFHSLFDHFAAAPILRLRFDETVSRERWPLHCRKLDSSKIVGFARCGWTKVYVSVGLTKDALAGTATDHAAFGDLIEFDDDRPKTPGRNCAGTMGCNPALPSAGGVRSTSRGQDHLSDSPGLHVSTA